MTKDYNPLEIKEGYIPRFITWCKKKIKAIVTIGSVGLVFAALQTYKAFFSPNIASEINNTIVSAVQDYEILKPIDIPNSMMSNQEVLLLKEYQDEFAIFKLYLSSLDYSKIEAEDDTIIFSIHQQRYNGAKAYGSESIKLLSCIIKIIQYEQEYVKNDSIFSATFDMNTMNQLYSTQNLANIERDNVLESIETYSNKGFANLTNKEKKDLYKNFEQGYASESALNTIKLQTKLFKNFFLVTNIRLSEIKKEHQKNQYYMVDSIIINTNKR